MKEFLTPEALLAMSKAEFRAVNGTILTTAKAVNALPEDHWLRTLSTLEWGDLDAYSAEFPAMPCGDFLYDGWDESTPTKLTAWAPCAEYIGHFTDGFDDYFSSKCIDLSWNKKAEELREPWNMDDVKFCDWWIHWEDWYIYATNANFYEEMGKAWAMENREKVVFAL